MLIRACMINMATANSKILDLDSSILPSLNILSIDDMERADDDTIKMISLGVS